jgi:transcriptional regulator with XRE-family HTH domain
MTDSASFYAEVGRRIRKAREEAGLTQGRLAELVSLTRTSVTNIEQGRQKLLLHTLADVAAALQVPAAELVPEARQEEDHDGLNKLLKGRPRKEQDWIKAAVKSVGKD